MASPSPATSSTRSSSTACSGSPSPAAASATTTLGGQLLFAYLHKEGYLHWTDNNLTIEWERVAEGVAGLRAEVQDLYHSGIDRSKLGQWITAHDLVSRYVPPADGSRWAKENRDLPEVEEPKELVDLVKDDEFPLSLFYVQLQKKLEPALARPSDSI